MLAERDTARVREVAPAKLNLALHVVGQRADGYHLLDSLVAFATLGEADGDVLEITLGDPPAEGPALTVDGPFASSVPAGADNTVAKAARAAGNVTAVHLTKRLPVAAGIGGGSGDAAAVLRAAAMFSGRPLSSFADTALALGADVPVCLMGKAARMRGIGEVLDPIAMPSVPALLVNPGIALSTPAVFKALRRKTDTPLPDELPRPTTVELFNWLRHHTRNDLEPAAASLAPVVWDVIELVSCLPGCALSRMSGSGATVFALFYEPAQRDAALVHLRANLTSAQEEAWWIAAADITPSNPGAGRTAWEAARPDGTV